MTQSARNTDEIVGAQQHPQMYPVEYATEMKLQTGSVNQGQQNLRSNLPPLLPSSEACFYSHPAGIQFSPPSNHRYMPHNAHLFTQGQSMPVYAQPQQFYAQQSFYTQPQQLQVTSSRKPLRFSQMSAQDFLPPTPNQRS